MIKRESSARDVDTRGFASAQTQVDPGASIRGRVSQKPGPALPLFSGTATHSYRKLSMKTSIHRFSILLLAAAALTSVVGCASTATRESTGQYLDDTAITAKVKAAIFNDASLQSAEINVETFKGVVQLSGFVNSAGDIQHAVQLVQGLSGVRSVRNDMRLK